MEGTAGSFPLSWIAWGLQMDPADRQPEPGPTAHPGEKVNFSNKLHELGSRFFSPTKLPAENTTQWMNIIEHRVRVRAEELAKLGLDS